MTTYLNFKQMSNVEFNCKEEGEQIDLTLQHDAMKQIPITEPLQDVVLTNSAGKRLISWEETKGVEIFTIPYDILVQKKVNFPQRHKFPSKYTNFPRRSHPVSQLLPPT